MNFDKLENEIGPENLEKVMESLLDTLCENGSAHSILYRETRKLHFKFKKIIDSIFSMNEEQLKQTTNFLKQINNLVDDYLKGMEK